MHDLLEHARYSSPTVLLGAGKLQAAIDAILPASGVVIANEAMFGMPHMADSGDIMIDVSPVDGRVAVYVWDSYVQAVKWVGADASGSRITQYRCRAAS